MARRLSHQMPCSLSPGLVGLGQWILLLYYLSRTIHYPHPVQSLIRGAWLAAAGTVVPKATTIRSYEMQAQLPGANIIHGTKEAVLVTKSCSNQDKESTFLLLTVGQISGNVQSLARARQGEPGRHRPPSHPQVGLWSRTMSSCGGRHRASGNLPPSTCPQLS